MPSTDSMKEVLALINKHNKAREKASQLLYLAKSALRSLSIECLSCGTHSLVRDITAVSVLRYWQYEEDWKVDYQYLVCPVCGAKSRAFNERPDFMKDLPAYVGMDVFAKQDLEYRK